MTMGNEIGGAARDIVTLSTGLSRKGHQVYVIAASGIMDNELEHTGVQFVNAPLYTRSPFGLLKASRIIRKIVREYKIEVLNPQGMYTALSAWLAHFGFNKCSYKIVTTIHMISNMHLYKYAWVLNIFSNRIITESYCERNRLVSNRVKTKLVKVISNSVDMDYFSKGKSEPTLRKEYDIDSKTCCFGIVARLSKEKRHRDFISAAKINHAQNPDTKYFIVGSGIEAESISREIAGAEDFIFMTGLRRDIPDILRSLDCFVLCSEQESLPLSIREAMSMELPVIATDVGGIREAVIEGITGFVVPSGNPELLAAAMGKITEDKNLRLTLGTVGRYICSHNFELTQWLRKTEILFSEVLSA